MTDTQSARIASEILSLLRQRGAGETICPSDVARRLPLDVAADDDGWSAWMPAVNAIAVQMARARMVVIMQRGQVVDPAAIQGQIRIGMSDQARVAG